MFGYSMCLTDENKNFLQPLFLVMMITGLQTERSFQRLINIVEIKFFERFTQIVGLFGSFKQFDCL